MKLIIACLLGLTMAVTASAQIVDTFGWEDGSATAIGTYGNLGTVEVVTDVVHTGTYALHMVEDPVGGTPQVFIAAVGGLQAGDEVTVSFWAFDDTEAASPSTRIWGHWTTGADIAAGYTGSASGSDTYSAGTGWEELTWTWTSDVDVNPDHKVFVCECRLYSAEAAVDYWIDDVTVTAPDHCTILFPNDPLVDTGPDTWSEVKALYR